MGIPYQQAMPVGVERVAAWSKLLDHINVFPIPDGDTGRNLVITLAPLRRIDRDPQEICRDLLFSARGNAGNIAARFFYDFIQADSLDNLPKAIEQGREQAWKTVGDPQPGTMLTFFDALMDISKQEIGKVCAASVNRIITHLEHAVLKTAEVQPVMKEAGIVDAGALGMFLFFDGFFNALLGKVDSFRPVTSIFGDNLKLSPSFKNRLTQGFCVDVVVRQQEGLKKSYRDISSEEENMVVFRDGDYVKIHLHTHDKERTRERMTAFGDILRWSDDDLHKQTTAFGGFLKSPSIHIMTDAAASITREDAQLLGITLLDSYITIYDTSLPETCFTPFEVYDAMRKGIPVSTSQAPCVERYQYYQGVFSFYPRVLYLCVGSVFSGNYYAALKWKEENDPENQLVLMDTFTASGRLGILATITARYAMENDNPSDVIAFAHEAVQYCEEYIFIDELKYLAAGGRLSKTGAFIGDMIHMKPIISPQADGAKRVGMVRTPDDQVRFAFQKLGQFFDPDSTALIMLEYSDNRVWVENKIAEEVAKRYPSAELIIKPISLTTGVHTGPGTWAVAFVPEQKK